MPFRSAHKFATDIPFAADDSDVRGTFCFIAATASPFATPSWLRFAGAIRVKVPTARPCVCASAATNQFAKVVS